ncbi:Protein CBG13865 [Caenorhabditis briggsae]|uniref:One cut domain family member n=1 Tax=Caenorhabditis briggsae TaxID=6238 RepID=A8XIV8_CAEBR|nr:Protein CBG13865 [Caenorhabditis briggsae]CAP32583.2 Protein CBG13865 [Caenorhabditis briggsae]
MATYFDPNLISVFDGHNTNHKSLGMLTEMGIGGTCDYGNTYTSLQSKTPKSPVPFQGDSNFVWDEVPGSQQPKRMSTGSKEHKDQFSSKPCQNSSNGSNHQYHEDPVMNTPDVEANYHQENRDPYFDTDEINPKYKHDPVLTKVALGTDLYNQQLIQKSRDVNDDYSNAQYDQQTLQNSTNNGSSDDLHIPDSLIQNYVHMNYKNAPYNHQQLHSSPIRMYNQGYSNTDNSNDQYTNQPINPYKRVQFQNSNDFNANSERRQPSHSVESIINKPDRRKQKPSMDEMAPVKQKKDYWKKIDDAYKRSKGFHGTQSTSSSDSQASSSSPDFEKFKYYEGLLAAPLANGAALDTKVLCNAVFQELETRKIPQTIFATRVANRVQGTLSELIRKPKPWDCVKSGRGVYVRLFNWYQLPEDQRMEIVDKKINWHVPEKKQTAGKRLLTLIFFRKRATKGPAPKKPRTEFTPVQKGALQTIFEENPKPSADVMAHIAQTLELDNDSVANFFQNTRKRTNDQMKRNRHPQNNFQDYQEDQQGEYY